MVASLYPHPIACIPLLAPRSAAVSYCKGALWDATAWKPLTNPTDAKQQVSCQLCRSLKGFITAVWFFCWLVTLACQAGYQTMTA